MLVSDSALNLRLLAYTWQCSFHFITSLISPYGYEPGVLDTPSLIVIQSYPAPIICGFCGASIKKMGRDCSLRSVRPSSAGSDIARISGTPGYFEGKCLVTMRIVTSPLLGIARTGQVGP